MVGSILSNLRKRPSTNVTAPRMPDAFSVLVLGMCFFAGGLKYSEQGFGASAYSTFLLSEGKMR